jgi:hypothetical protein
MKRRKVVFTIGLAVVLFVVVGYFILRDSLPPRTPHKIARTLSTLQINDNFKVEKFKDNLKGGGSAVPSGDLFIEFKLSEEQFLELKQQVQDAKYQQLPVKNFIYTPDFATNLEEGFYMLDESSPDPLEFKLIVLSEKDRRLYVYLSDS